MPAQNETLLAVLTELGLSRAAATELLADATKVATARTQAKRKAQLAKIPYLQWLRAVSPEYNWQQPFQKLIAAHLDAIVTGDLRRLAIFLPPRSGKSLMVTQRFPVYLIERDPRARIIVGAYNRDLAASFATESLKIYRGRNPDTVEKEAAEEWTTAAGGGVLAVGVGSGVTGRGANCLIMDDVIKGAEEAASAAYQNRVWNWWQNDMRTRLNDIATTPVILIMTRWSESDIAARIMEQDKRGLWKVISFPALATENDLLGRKENESLWPERMPVSELLAMQDEMGLGFEALYQQNPTPGDGGLVKESWFWYSTYDPVNVIATVRFWDLAASATSRTNRQPDYTVGVKMAAIRLPDGETNYCVVDVARIRAEPDERDAFMDQTMRDDGEDVAQVMEEGDDGDKTVTAYARKRNPTMTIEGRKPRRDKIVRSQNARAALGKGKVFLLVGRWNYAFVDELVRFPNGKFDDQMDGYSGAFNELLLRSLVVKVR